MDPRRVRCGVGPRAVRTAVRCGLRCAADCGAIPDPLRCAHLANRAPHVAALTSPTPTFQADPPFAAATSS